ncbi:MAG: hypothetical protein R3B40_28770 [Polyangiales bacterium]
MLALRDARELRLSDALRLEDARTLISVLLDRFERLVLVQESYSPHEAIGYCSVHDFHYGGSLGCHLCIGFYQR